ncbi:peptidyl-tRNA hydrolase [Sphaerisporangium rubeum]|uniref:peptidyl-tRNA hydrolase n=1 Tax=Sphaerisporangium rubeum TaxID=321317 RepID=A0A7X0M5S0_9ACTN|nr:peptidyl-tRNA hydrolase [Sphaerisporangium rubeum]MBB6472472.1 peptidyl-tRNA hydrolase [Sphaerisporangium rubeum]
MSPLDHPDQRVLPLVVRVERAAPPSRTDALEATATAVLRLLDDERSTSGEWAEAIRAWETAAIRKVVRRARGAEWRRVLDLPGITVELRSAQVRVHPPVPLDGWPRDLSRLQVSGTDLTDGDDEPGPPDESGPVLWMNPGLTMSAGKAMAQAGHAAQLAWWGTGAEARRAWRDGGLTVAVRTAGQDRWAELAGGDLPIVRDAGFTEIEPGSRTVVADAPWLRAGGARPAAWGPLRDPAG